MAQVVVRPATRSLPDDLADLAHEAEVQGVRNVSTLIARWIDGSEVYTRVGESMLVAWLSGSVVGVGGLAWCPHVPGALRVRRFYVAIDARRRGVARRLATQLIDTAVQHVDVVTCNARASAEAPPFWEAMGFRRTDLAGITHVLDRGM